jgi:hypothetical protein
VIQGGSKENMSSFNLLFLFILLLISACSHESVENDIRNYSILFESQRIPTLLDFENSCGAVDDGESDFEMLICELKKWPEPSNKNGNLCAEYMKERWKNAG